MGYRSCSFLSGWLIIVKLEVDGHFFCPHGRKLTCAGVLRSRGKKSLSVFPQSVVYHVGGGYVEKKRIRERLF